MSLRPTDFDQYVLASDRIDYFEARLGEAFEINMTFTTGTPAVAQDLTGWTFSVEYVDCTASIAGTGTDLTSVSNITILNATPQTDVNLRIANIVAASGTAILVIPATVMSMPAASAPIDSTNTLVKLFQITATFAGQVSGNNQVRKIAIGGIIRWAEA